MRGIDGFVFAFETGGDEGCETSDDKTVGIDQHPLLIHLAGLGREGFHGWAELLPGVGITWHAKRKARRSARTRPEIGLCSSAWY